MGATPKSGVDALADARPQLWLLAVAFFGVGDVVTTTAGLQAGTAVEVGPFVGPLLRDHGYAAMMGLKVGTFGVCYAGHRRVVAPHNVGIPLGLATLGVLVTGWNLFVLAHTP